MADPNPQGAGSANRLPPPMSRKPRSPPTVGGQCMTHGCGFAASLPTMKMVTWRRKCVHAAVSLEGTMRLVGVHRLLGGAPMKVKHE